MTVWRPLVAATVAFTCMTPHATAVATGSLWDNVSIRGVAYTNWALGFDDADLNKIEFGIEPELDLDLGAWGRITALGRIRFDGADELEPGQGGQFERATISRRLHLGDHGDAELRELYWDVDISSSFLRLGKQQVVWGQADGLRVLDVLNPLDFREWILGDLEDRRIPVWMANLEVPLGEVNAQFIWIPDHTYDDVPDFDAAFGPGSSLLIPQIPGDLPLSATLQINGPDRPGRFIKDDDYGVRLSAFSGGWDLSLNYLYHYNDRQVIRRFIDGSDLLSINPGYERTHLIGGSASNSFGKATLRVEAGYSTDRFFLTQDVNDQDGVFRSGAFESVIGVDYPVDSDLFLSAQLFQSYLTTYDPRAARSRLENTVTFLMTKDVWNDTAIIKSQIIHSLDRHDGQVELIFSYDLRSDVVLSVGANIFYGDNDGLFGQFHDRDRLTFGVDYSF